MALDLAAQRGAKHDMVLDILARTGKLDASKAAPVALEWHDLEQPRAVGYRTRIRVHIKDGRLGFLARASHTLVPIAHCLVANATVNEALRELTRCSELSPSLYDAFEQVEIRALGEHPDLLWIPRSLEDSTPPGARRHRRAPKPQPASGPRKVGDCLATLRRSLANLSPDSTHWLMSVRADTESWRENAQTASLDASNDAGSPRLLFAPGMFTQVNWQINQAIVLDVLEHVKTLGTHTFLDLYCGAGNFSLPLLANGLEGVGIEANEFAVSAAQAACTHQRLSGHFVSGDVARHLKALVARNESFDLVLLDPPRAGFKDAAAYLPRLARQWVFICACDPTTFARDLRALLDLGFTLDTLTAYDMFPQTHHVELTAWLRRAAS